MRFLHTSINVKDMDVTIKFYITHLGLQLLRRVEITENNAEIAFLSSVQGEHKLELTYWRDKKDYIEGDQLDHLAFDVNNLDSTILSMKKAGVEIAKEPFSLKGGEKRIAFIKDPNGIWVELIEKV